jgi:hypothetical protein
MIALVRALSALGGYARPRQAYDWIRENTGLAQRMPKGTKVSEVDHFEREVRFGRQELAEGGILATAEGSWRLLDSCATDLSVELARRITRDNTRRRRERRARARGGKNSESISPSRPTMPSIGPRPTAWQGTVRRELGPASTYLLRFEGSDIWKVGFAVSVEGRLREINQHVPVELIGRRWLMVKTQRWASSEMAHRMEQAVLVRLSASRTVYERVRCSEAEVVAGWEQALADTQEA